MPSSPTSTAIPRVEETRVGDDAGELARRGQEHPHLVGAERAFQRGLDGEDADGALPVDERDAEVAPEGLLADAGEVPVARVAVRPVHVDRGRLLEGEPGQPLLGPHAHRSDG